MRKFLVFALALLLPVMAFAATGKLTGKIIDGNTDLPLVTAQVQLAGTTLGAVADLSGEFYIPGIPAGHYSVRCTYLGYVTKMVEVDIEDGKTLTINFELEESFLNTKDMTFFATRAKERETPVAFSNVEKLEIEQRMGSRDVPLILNTTPGIYATNTGGGSGDSRINVRGFDQRNVAVMLNGVPVNDMENGWVYWSNWDGLGDVTSSIQVQRGLAAANIAVPSVGGTINILTDAASFEPGLKYRSEVGSGDFSKQTMVASTGLINNKFALTVLGSRKKSMGMAENLWSDAWSYFIGASYLPAKNHKIDAFWFGAPQRHGQRTYEQEIEKYDYDLAKENGVPTDGSEEIGYDYNPHWGYVSADAGDTKEYFNGGIHDPMFDNRLNERENFYHKPQGNINWYWDINDDMRLTNVVYLSIGIGGGTGGYGKLQKTGDRHIDWNKTIGINRGDIAYGQDDTGADLFVTADDDGLYAGKGILRNSVNEHNWYGWVGKFDYTGIENLKTTFGLDIRMFEGIHYRQVRNLLGADYYVDTKNANDEGDETKKGLGDKIAYHNVNNVRQFGGFLQNEYKMNDLSAVLSLGVNSVGYKMKDYFQLEEDGQEIDWQNVLGYYVKGGLNYNLNDELNVYTNMGYNAKPPIFDGVIYDGMFDYNDDPKNETIMGFELGSGYIGFDRKVQINANVYYTIWNDRVTNIEDDVIDAEGNEVEYLYTLEGVDANHYGFEIDFKIQPVRKFRFDGSISIGNWEWTDDVDARFAPTDDPTIVETAKIYLKDLKVGDAAQTSASIAATFMPVGGSFLTLTWSYFGDLYANFDPEDRRFEEGDEIDRAQPWEIPSYTMMDLHAGYEVPNKLGVKIEVLAHVFNLLDTKYIAEGTDMGYASYAPGNEHTADAATVYVGLPRTWTAGLQFTF